MSEIFISYAREDRVRARRLARSFEQEGWSVFWDRKIPPGKTFDLFIEAQLAEAAVVVVLWSEHSIVSDWVKTEAAEGAKRAILVPALLDEVIPPLEFRRLQAADLTEWYARDDPPSGAEDAAFGGFLAAVRSLVQAGRTAGGDPTAVSEAGPGADRVLVVEERRPHRPEGETSRLGSWGRWALPVAALLVVAGVIVWQQWPAPGSPEPGPPDNGGGHETRPSTVRCQAEGDRVFTLEVLDADHGESYLLHYGSSAGPRFLLIDGGSGRTFTAVLEARLEQLRRACSPGRSLALERVIVTHQDDDRVGGILRLLGVLAAAKSDGAEPPYEVRELWFNGFAARVGMGEYVPEGVRGRLDLAAGRPARAAAVRARPRTAVLLASTRQAVDLMSRLQTLGIPLNPGFGRFLQRERVPRSLEDSLSVMVIGPTQEQLEDLFRHWSGDLERRDQLDLLGPPPTQAAFKTHPESAVFSFAVDRRTVPAGGDLRRAAYVDTSVTNLASLIVLFELDGKRILITGDARGDHVLEGLAQLGLLEDDEPFHVDLLQVPHQGSDRSVDTDFFRKVTADHYAISGNGRHGNPESATLAMISSARGSAQYTLHFTHPDGEDQMRERLIEFFTAEAARGRDLSFRFRSADSPSLKINLIGRVQY